MADAEEDKAPEFELPLTKFPLDAEVEISFDAQDIAANLNRQQVLKLIQELDDEIGSWPVTLLLAEYFSAQAQIAKDEGCPVIGLSSEQLMQRIADADAKEAAGGQ